MPEAHLWRTPDAPPLLPPAAKWLRYGVLALAGVVGVAALSGGALLALSPDGSLLMMPPSWLEGTPFSSYLVPGLLLFGLGLLHGVAVFALALRLGDAWLVAGLAGGGMVVWIVVEMLLVADRFWLQGVLLVLGAATWAGAVAMEWQRRGAARA